MNYSYDKTSPRSILEHAQEMLERSLRDVLPEQEVSGVSERAREYGTNRKGHLGNLVEKFVFGIEPNSSPEPDFPEAGVELKTTPLKKHPTRTYSAKERLVFSMIDYKHVVNETWETSSFLRKNQLLLLMFYLYDEGLSLLDYKFKIIRLLSLLSEISREDIRQIRKDWQVIVDKIKQGEAHTLSEGDTFYLGACTKSASGESRCEQAVQGAPLAKPRAFSLKQSYLNYIIQESLKGPSSQESLFKDGDVERTIEEYVNEKFAPLIGLRASEIQERLDLKFSKRPKNYFRSLANGILGVRSQKIKELEKADVTMKVIALEPSGILRESISFPYFDYCKIVEQSWEGSELYDQLNSRRFLFVVFRKEKNGDAVLEKVKFWNFPFKDLDVVQQVWDETVKRILDRHADDLPKINDNPIAHVRPHGKDSKDKIMTPYGVKEVKKSFWLNAKYIQKQLEA